MQRFGTPRRARLMTSAATGAALLLSGVAFAQDAAEEEDREIITVTGIRASIEGSIEAKKNSTSIVEAVSAEDIGKLPDLSIAESIARLPGLAAQRLRGRSTVISVRGLGPDFTTALLNGREQVTAGDNRGVEFDQYPAELVNQVLVYKTPDAALLGQGLAGTADLRTIRPLAYGERSLSANARYEWNELGGLNAGTDGEGYRLTGMYVDQFANDTIGVVFGLATQSSPTQAERFEAWGYPTTGAGEFIIGGAKPYVESRDLDRDAVVGTVEFEPNAAFRTSFDAFYTQFEDTGVLRGIELPLFWSGAQLQPGYTITDGVVTQGQFNGVKGVVRNDYRGREATSLSLGWNAQYDLSDAWALEADLSMSRVERDDIDLELYSGTGAGGAGATDNLGFTLGDTIEFSGSSINYNDPATIFLTDPGGWGQVGFIKEPSTEDELTALRLSAERQFDKGAISSVEFGINISEREKSRVSLERFIDLANPGATNTAVIPAQYLLGGTNQGYLGLGDTISFDPLDVFYNSGLVVERAGTDANFIRDVAVKAWDVTEKVNTAFVMANIDSAVSGTPVKGNFGVQIVQTDQSSGGISVLAGDTSTRFVAGDEYTNVLPSLNLQFELANNQFIRFGAASTIARARMDQMRASQSLSLNTGVCSGAQPYNLAQRQVCFNVDGGQPALRPYKANSVDISYEKYFGGSGYVSAAAFYKDLQDYVIDNVAQPIDLTTFANAVATANGFTIPVEFYTGILNGPANGDGGSLQGLEFATSIPGDLFLPAPFDGFGVLASVSFTESEVRADSGSPVLPIPGLSETVGNITLFYEKEGFEARISNRYRSEFLGEVVGFGANIETRQIRPESVVDAQLGYSFDAGPLSGFSVLLQANNLTNERFGTYTNGDERLVRNFEEYGTTYVVGLNYRR